MYYILPIPNIIKLIKTLTTHKIAHKLHLTTPNNTLVNITLNNLSILLKTTI
jgi:hypothetical protein